MATEEDRQDERDRLGNDPLSAPERDGPHGIEEKLESVDEYQAPPRNEEQEEGEPADPENDEPVDLNLLESKGHNPGLQPGLQISETIDLDPSHANYTISGRDEESQPDNPGAVPARETM